MVSPRHGRERKQGGGFRGNCEQNAAARVKAGLTGLGGGSGILVHGGMPGI